MSYLKKDHRGCLIYVSLSSTDDQPVKDEITEDAPKVALDLELITKTVSSIRSWLKTAPTQEEAQQVFDYEVANSNRVSAVGEEGCLTTFLQGE